MITTAAWSSLCICCDLKPVSWEMSEEMSTASGAVPPPGATTRRQFVGMKPPGGARWLYLHCVSHVGHDLHFNLIVPTPTHLNLATPPITVSWHHLRSAPMTSWGLSPIFRPELFLIFPLLHKDFRSIISPSFPFNLPSLLGSHPQDLPGAAPFDVVAWWLQDGSANKTS